MKRLFRRKRKNPNSQEIGLRIANIFGRYFLKTDHLHYGFWPEGLPVALENLPKAQDLYTEFLRARIPASEAFSTSAAAPATTPKCCWLRDMKSTVSRRARISLR